MAVGFQNDALKFDIADKTETGIEFFDGFAQYEFAPSGDVFAGFGIGFELGKPDVVGFPPTKETMQKLLQKFTVDKVRGKHKPAIDIEGSIFLNTGSGEKLFMLVIESIEFSPKDSFLQFSLGSGFAAIRQDSAVPDCQPNGIFISSEFDLQLGDALESILSLTPKVRSDFGVVTKPGLDGVDATFFRFSSEMNFLGLQESTIDACKLSEPLQQRIFVFRRLS